MEEEGDQVEGITGQAAASLGSCCVQGKLCLRFSGARGASQFSGSLLSLHALTLRVLRAWPGAQWNRGAREVRASP